MEPLLSALTSLATALEMDRALAQTIASMEHGLASALGAERVAIGVGEVSPSAPPGPRDETLPLVLDGKHVGTATFTFPRGPSDRERDYVRALAAPLALALAWRSHASERVRLSELVRTDGLTRLANRMAFDERLDAAWQSAAERRASVTLAILDIDYFKIYNDIYGHVGGDDCLRTVAQRLALEARREGAFVARYGGEEFGWIAESLEPGQALAAVARILESFERTPIPHGGSTLGRVSISAGVASGPPAQWVTIADFVREADRSLYRAKALGRNRMCAGTYASAGPIASRSARSISGPPAFDDATVGREADVTRLLSALRQARMISLVGPAGIGKSRLACSAGNAAGHFVSDGVAYVDFSLLAPDSDPVGALAAGLDIAYESSASREGLCEAVKERHMLIVLDNVAESMARRIAPLCDDLLAAAPRLSILATSRSALGCAEERTMVVGPLGPEAALELLCIRSGSPESAALRNIALALGGTPATLEDMGRLLAAQRRDSTRRAVYYDVNAPGA